MKACILLLLIAMVYPYILYSAAADIGCIARKAKIA